MDESPSSPCLRRRRVSRRRLALRRRQVSRRRRETEPSHAHGSPTAYAAADTATADTLRRETEPSHAHGSPTAYAAAATDARLRSSFVALKRFFPRGQSGGFFPGRERGGRSEFAGSFTGAGPTEQSFTV
jgi:hypothetical protein